MHWKLARDPFLGPLAQVQGEQVAWDAGFFLDADNEHRPLDDADWLCTPRPRCVRAGERPVVLLATGGFCPVHEGHLAMMQAARAAATNAGFTVIGGYLSPGHDDYVRLKCGAEAIPASIRLEQCAAAAATARPILPGPTIRIRIRRCRRIRCGDGEPLRAPASDRG